MPDSDPTAVIDEQHEHDLDLAEATDEVEVVLVLLVDDCGRIGIRHRSSSLAVEQERPQIAARNRGDPV